MKRLDLLVVFALAFVAPVCPVAYAQDVAIVDVQKVVNESIIGKAAKSNVEAQIQKAKARMANLQSDLEKGKADLQKQSAVLSGSALEERREALEKKQREAQRTFGDLQEQLAKANDKEIKKVVDEIDKVVGEIADDKEYAFVFEKDRQAVLYAAPRIDITQDVIKILDKRKLDL
jgi:outer membrane protein